MGLPKRLRYEVLRRDNHACRYCGATAPDAALTVDHVVPVALGGTDDPGNLVAACVDCNAGKASAAPDQPLLDQVADDAIRWARAMEQAAASVAQEKEYEREVVEWFRVLWNEEAPYFAGLPADYGTSVLKFVAAGLSFDQIREAVNRAACADHVSQRARFRYFCGIAWRMLADLRERALSILETEPADGP